MGFGGECGNSRAARADGAGIWVYNRRAEQLACMECDWAAHTTALGTADAAKWVSRQKNRLRQPRATIGMSMTAGRCGRPTAEAAERRLEAGVFAAFQVATVDLWISRSLHPERNRLFNVKMLDHSAPPRRGLNPTSSGGIGPSCTTACYAFAALPRANRRRSSKLGTVRPRTCRPLPAVAARL